PAAAPEIHTLSLHDALPISHDMNGLCPWRHSARLLNPRPDHRLGHLPKLEMANDAVLVDEEGAREGQHAEAPRGRPVAVEDRLQDRKSTRLNSSHVKTSYAV